MTHLATGKISPEEIVPLLERQRKEDEHYQTLMLCLPCQFMAVFVIYCFVSLTFVTPIGGLEAYSILCCHIALKGMNSELQ